MKEENFEVFIEILKVVEKEELKGNKINDVISSMIDNFYPDMTDEQKKRIKEEFSFYIRRETFEMEDFY